MSKELLQHHYDDLIRIYAQAFAGYPWFENLSRDTVSQRIQIHTEKPGFELVVAENSGILSGATWFYEDTDEGVTLQKNGQELLSILNSLREIYGVSSLVYICETIVNPNNQGQGIASKLKTMSIDLLQEKYPSGVLAYTRMRDDNQGIIKINTRAGFSRSGVTVPSSSNPDLRHEYWYKVINPQKQQA
jgi:ribosomal protein S18 acetylase RimI-like enzyme